ncbi:CHAT domain-containing protein [Microbacterium sp.]|uniref:CHAT domain-containing protein n=1 Tax=Microbacterium sp. TaxID=51671 RepID=UPI0039E66519
MPLSAGELHRRGLEAANTRRYAQARRDLAAASARTDDPDLRARIDGTSAYVLAQTGEPAAAEALSREALARPGLAPETVAVLCGQLGVLLMHSGRLDEADAMLTRAIDAMPGDSVEFAHCLMNRAMVRMQRHELDEGMADLEQAALTYEAAGDWVSNAEARHNLGYAALLGGDLVTALRLMTQSRPVFAETSELATAISDLDRAEVLRDAGLTTEAEALLGEVAARFGAQRMRQARGEAEFHLARSLLRHDAPAAVRTARTAVRRFTALRSTGWAARAEAVRLEAAVRAGRPPSAQEFAAASDALIQGGFRTEAAALRLTARQAGHGPRPRIGADAPVPLRVRDHEVRAARSASRGRDAEARRIAAAGLDLLANGQESFGALDLQSSVSMQASDLVFTGLAAAARSRRPEVLFEWSERARHLSQQVTPVRPPHDADLAADLAALRMLRADLAGSDWTGDARVRALRDRVRERQWSTTTTGRALTRLGLAEAQSLLDRETAVLSYVYTGAELQCVVATASDARIVPLAWRRVQEALDGLRADLDVAALTRGGPMAAFVERALDERLARLDAELLAPARAAAGPVSRLVLTVPGILSGIPWAMLPGMHATPFTLATSVSRWSADRPPSPPSPPHPGRRPTWASAPHLGDVAQVGHRGADGASAEEGGGSAAGGAGRGGSGFAAGPRVPRALDEVQRASAAWEEATVLTGDDARVDAVTALAARSEVLHIAAHGRHAADNPLFSGLELADGTLFGYDVDLIERTPDTVVLSACELGRSSVRWGEEALGMTRVWLHAGTRCVIAAPVVVADAVAAELLAALHTGLARGEDPAAALAAASVSTGLRAPFQCHGSGF